MTEIGQISALEAQRLLGYLFTKHIVVLLEELIDKARKENPRRFDFLLEEFGLAKP